MKRNDRLESSGSNRLRSLNTSRRSFIAQLAGLPPVFWLGCSTQNVTTAQEIPTFSPNTPYSRAFNFASLNQWLTPNSQFFVRSHFGIPKIDVSRWTATVTGAVQHERTFTLQDLMKFPVQEQVAMLECAGNEVGTGMVSNARWTGISLGALLRSVGLSANAREVVLVGMDGGLEKEDGGSVIDGFARSLPIAKALRRSTLLAFKMNGESLPSVHGGPVRAIVPGWYGMDSVKWLKQIVVTTQPFDGFYQTRRYYEARVIGSNIERAPLQAIRVKSQIGRPVRGEILHVEPVTLVGAAWSGEAEITNVELSFDGGSTWHKAALGAEHAPFAWRLWSYDWTPRAPATYEVVVRARDSLNQEQPVKRDPRILTPYANNWVERRSIVVR